MKEWMKRRATFSSQLQYLLLSEYRLGRQTDKIIYTLKAFDETSVNLEGSNWSE